MIRKPPCGFMAGFGWVGETQSSSNLSSKFALVYIQCLGLIVWYLVHTLNPKIVFFSFLLDSRSNKQPLGFFDSKFCFTKLLCLL